MKPPEKQAPKGTPAWRAVAFGLAAGLSIGWFLWFGVDGERADSFIDSITSADESESSDTESRSWPPPLPGRTPTSQPTATKDLSPTITASSYVIGSSTDYAIPTEAPVGEFTTSWLGWKCEGYDDWIAGTNDRVARTNVILSLLDQGEPKDFFGLDLRAMEAETQRMIQDQRDSNPPNELEEMNDQNVKRLELLLDLVQAANSDDLDQYYLAGDEYMDFQDQLPEDPNEVIRNACE